MGSRYTRERLEEAVAGASTLSEAITRLGEKPTRGRRDYLRKLLRRWEIDSSHLRPGGVRHTERDLHEAAALSSSVAEVVRRLGISPVGGNQAHVGRRLAKLDIDTSHFTSRCARRTRTSPRTTLLSLGRPEDGRISGKRLRHALLRAGVAEHCAECGSGPVRNGRALRLEVDHLNGEWWDNRRRNLRLLCPNCHAVTDTYRGRKRRDGGTSGAGP